MLRRMILYFCLAILPLAWSPVLAQDTAAEAAGRKVERPGRTGLPLPRFVSLRAAEVNMRIGPGVRYPIDWVYQRRNLPVEIVDEHIGGEFDAPARRAQDLGEPRHERPEVAAVRMREEVIE